MGLRLYVNGKDLKDLPVVQNEKGVYYLNPDGSYWKPKLADFDSAKGKPAKTTKHTDGSHVPYGAEAPIDWSVLGDITGSDSVKINGFYYLNDTYRKLGKPYGFEVVYGNAHKKFIHVKTKWKAGDRVPAGQVIGTVMTPAENLASGRYSIVKGKKVGFPSHFHGASNNTSTFSKETMRQMVLAPIDPPPVVTPPTEPPKPPTEPTPCEKEVLDLKEKLRNTELDRDTYKKSFNDKCEELRIESEKRNTSEQERDRYLEAVNAISALIPVTYDPKLEWTDQHWAYEGALERRTADRISGVELFKALLIKLFSKLHVKSKS